MARTVIIPAGLEEHCARLGMSPGVLSHAHIFLTGVTGSAADGIMPETEEAQFHACFRKIGSVLAEAGLGLDSVVDMTSYHVGLRAHFDLFDRVRRIHLSDPFPTWTAVEVAGLRREGAVVEIRAVAALT